MLYVLIALMPATIFGVINFGIRALLLILVCVAVCVASEWIYEKLIHKKSTINDFSAAVTGLSPYAADLAGGIGQRVCNCNCQNAVWRPGTEFYESRAGRKMFPAGVICGNNDELYV